MNYLKVLFYLSFICVVLFSCEDKENNYSFNKLKSVEYTIGLSKKTDLINTREVYGVEYDDNNRIVKFGNSTFSYNEKGKVEKEIYKIKSNNKNELDENISYHYFWDDFNRLTDIEIVSNSHNKYTLSAKKKIYYELQNSTPSQIDTYDNLNNIVKSIVFYHTKEKLDSIEYIVHNTGNKFLPTDYRNWGLGGSVADVPKEGSVSMSKFIINKLNTSNNFFRPLFHSLGFVPRDLPNQYQNDILLPYLVNNEIILYLVNNKNDLRYGASSFEYILNRNGLLNSMISSNHYSPKFIFNY